MIKSNFMEKMLEGVEVEWRALGEIFNLKNGYTPSKTNSKYWTDGTIPWFRMEDIRKNGRILCQSIQYVNEGAVKGNQVFPANSIIIATSATIGEHALITVPYLSNQRFTNLSLKHEFVNKFLMKFLFYYGFILDEWCKNNVSVGNFASVDMIGFKKISIPIPPLKVQKEIVRILDTFTELTIELIAELTAELRSRKKQYSYYRDKLLTFGEGEVEWKSLGDIADVTKLAGYEFTEHIKYSDSGSVIALRGLNIKKGFLDLSSVKYIDGSNFKKLTRSKLFVDDILFTYVGTIGEVALVDVNDRYYLAPNVARIRVSNNDIHPKFMKFYFQSHYFKEKQINRYLSSSSMKNLTMENIRKFLVPIPTISEQERIVSILDKFDALTSSITEGLPREIELRKKQYEYYRNMLFSFPKEEV